MRQSTHKKCTHSGCSSSRVVYHDCQLGNANDFTRLVCYHFRDPDVAHWNETCEPVVEETAHSPASRSNRNKVNLEEAVDQMSQMTASLIVLTAEETIEYMKQVPVSQMAQTKATTSSSTYLNSVMLRAYRQTQARWTVASGEFSPTMP